MKKFDRNALYVVGCLFALIVLFYYYNNVIEAYTNCSDVPNSVGCSGCTNIRTTSGNRCMWDKNSKQRRGAETHCNSFDGVKIPSQCPNNPPLRK